MTMSNFSSREPDTTFWLCGHQAHAWHIDIHAGPTPTHIRSQGVLQIVKKHPTSPCLLQLSYLFDLKPVSLSISTVYITLYNIHNSLYVMCFQSYLSFSRLWGLSVDMQLWKWEAESGSVGPQSQCIGELRQEDSKFKACLGYRVNINNATEWI